MVTHKNFGKPVNKTGNSSSNPDRVSTKGGQRSKSTIMRLNMYKRGKPVRDKDGTVIGGTLLMGNKSGGKDMSNMARIQPDRRWFGNTRTIKQTDLDKFREEMTVKAADPYSVVLRRKKIPMTLLADTEKINKVNLLESESYENTFGSKIKRKRPKMGEELSSYEKLIKSASEKITKYEEDPTKDSNIEVEAERGGDMRKDDLFSKGQSKRIWAELYKVLDCSDVVIQVIDARNVPGTRCEHIEKHVKKNASHKHMVIVINKCDLVPSWVTRKWVKKLSEQFPTLAFHASLTNAFGKGALISLLRQYSKLHSDKRQISVGIIGYPNTGKSSVINALMGKKCCKTAPIPGETKVWQYITLMKRIYLIDCPGVVYDVGDSETETVLKGVVRAERLTNPIDFIQPILERVKKEYIQKQYMIADWDNHIDFVSKVAIRNGKLLKGGEPDLFNVSVHVINDWQRGKLPYFVAPPKEAGEEEETVDDSDEQPLAVSTNNDDDDDDNNNIDDNDGNDNDDNEDDDDEEEEDEVATSKSKSKFKSNKKWGDL